MLSPAVSTKQGFAFTHKMTCAAFITCGLFDLSLLDSIDILLRICAANSLLELNNWVAQRCPLERKSDYNGCSELRQLCRIKTFTNLLEQERRLGHGPAWTRSPGVFSSIPLPLEEGLYTLRTGLTNPLYISSIASSCWQGCGRRWL